MLGIYSKYNYYCTPFSCDTTPGKTGFVGFRNEPFVRCIWAPLAGVKLRFPL